MNIRAARKEDVPAILDLVTEHARRGDLLPRTPESIVESLPDWLVGKDENGHLVACVSLLAYTPALAEVRSLAVADAVKGQGWGRTILKAAIQEARRRDTINLFALTRAVSFFERAGFQTTNRERFPEKVWRDCRACPLLDRCDETAVMLNLRDLQATRHPQPAAPSHPIPLPHAQAQPERLINPASIGG